jgi:hypothetical protein
MSLLPAFRDGLRTLVAAGVVPALCGSHAAQVHGLGRGTEDIDLLVANAEVEQALDALGRAGWRIGRTAAGPGPGVRGVAQRTGVDDVVRLRILVPGSAASPRMESTILGGHPLRVVGKDERFWLATERLGPARPRSAGMIPMGDVLRRLDGIRDLALALADGMSPRRVGGS